MASQVSLASYQFIGAHTKRTDLSTVKEIQIATGANGVLIQAITQNVRYTLDGSNPTASVGFRLTAGNDPIFIPAPERNVIRLIEETVTAELQYQQAFA